MVEDDDGHARLIERNIRRAGVNNEIVAFTDGTSALSYLLGADGSGEVSSGRALLILLDLNLPDMHGADVLQTLQRQASTVNIPVVILSANATPSQIERLLTAGARNYLTKPFNIDPFLAVVDEFTAAARVRAA
jgi:DNA-binding response OmpR family regulator